MIRSLGTIVLPTQNVSEQNLPQKSQVLVASHAQEHDVRVYRTVIEVLADLGPASAPYASLLRARLEAGPEDRLCVGQN